MSVAYYIALNKETPDFDNFMNGKSLAKACDKIDELCQLNRISTLSDFEGESIQNMMDLLDDESDENIEELSDNESNDEKWFDAETGIEFIKSITLLIQNSPEFKSHFKKEYKNILEDFKTMNHILLHAQKINAKWHLAIDF